MTPPRGFACAVLLTKNEYDMIGDFLEYYGRLLGGREHVIVIDNGSDHPDVLAEYAAHVAKGGRVIVETRPFSQALDFMSGHLLSMTSSYEWLLPIETDEIVYDTNGGVDVVPERVGAVLREHLRAQDPTVGAFMYSTVMSSLVDPSDPGHAHGAHTRPVVQITRFYNQRWDKLLLRSDAFLGIHMWCHSAVIRSEYKTVRSPTLGLLHFNETGRRRRIERSDAVVRGCEHLRIVSQGTLEERLWSATLLKDAPVHCGHKVKFLFDHLSRLYTLLAFRRIIGRMPHDHVEMSRYASAGCAAPHAIRRDAAQGSIGGLSCAPGTREQPCFDELLYHEERAEAPDGELQRTHRVRLDTDRGPDSSRNAESVRSPPRFQFRNLGIVF